MIVIDPIAITDLVLTSTNVAETDYAAYNSGTSYALGDKVILTSATSTVTFSIASPCVVTWTAHGLADRTPIYFTSSGTLPSGIVSGTQYYVVAVSTNTFQLSTTVGGAALTTSGSQSGTHTAVAQIHKIFESLQAANTAHYPPAAASSTWWTDSGATNARKMFDSANSSQTVNASSIVVSFAPVVVVNGIYLGAVDADSVTVTVTDLVEGLVYTETQSMIMSNSNSSFWRWYFGRIKNKTIFVSTSLPSYINATITVTLTKSSGSAKCGMCVLGTLEDVGFTQYGVGLDIKDYSTTQFNFDGSSTTVERGFVKRMSADVVLNNDIIDSVYNTLSQFRQRNVVWIGGTQYESSIVYGKFSSFKNIIADVSYSKMSLQIDGVI
jgi:hypothetical protein